MPPKSTPNPAASNRRDLDDLVTAILEKLEGDDPAWAASLVKRLKDARARAASRSRRPKPS